MMHQPHSPIAAHSPDPLMVGQSASRGLGAATPQRRAPGLLRGVLRPKGWGTLGYFHSATLQRWSASVSHMSMGARAQGVECVAPLRALRSLSPSLKPIKFNKLVKIRSATAAATGSILSVAGRGVANRIYSGVFSHG